MKAKGASNMICIAMQDLKQENGLVKMGKITAFV
jgi:hypothetical protein